MRGYPASLQHGFRKTSTPYSVASTKFPELRQGFVTGRRCVYDGFVSGIASAPQDLYQEIASAPRDSYQNVASEPRDSYQDIASRDSYQGIASAIPQARRKSDAPLGARLRN